MSDNGNKQIEEKFLDSGDLFVLKYNGGYKFFNVEMWEQTAFEPYDNIGTVAGQGNAGFERLEDENGDDILYSDQGSDVVLHVGIGQSPSFVQRYTNYPEGENRLRTLPNLSVPSSRNGDNFGAVDGNDSPYDAPTEAEELFIPPNTNIDFDFYNPSTEAVAPKLNIVIREYYVNEIDPKKNPDVVRRCMSPGSPVPIAPVGSADNQKGTSRGNWDIDPATRTEITNILNNN